ncbi:DUF3515 family protein [Microbacterium sp. ARD32]|uniref:DUF3515 family protein n=1 Tax=Microbacterium sp. ARD32 TaxID=2962577 RepID=UPI002880E7FF|nr:DUF3515 family protein [Microbacterium sp. ARD32]MDT0157025.1 DUF3515 family protein [Microbacterium sp. ARD32]
MLRRSAPIAGALLLLALSGCSSTVALEPAQDANNPACAEVSVRLPDAIGDLPRRWTDAQATAAYGDPTAVIVACGVEVPGPTAELQCVTLDGVDWLVDDTLRPKMRMTSYGRDPAVQVFVDTEVIGANEVLTNSSLVGGVRTIPATSKCIAPDELPE